MRRLKGVSGIITPRWQANARLVACGKTLPMSGTRNTFVAQADDARGPRLSGNCRVDRFPRAGNVTSARPPLSPGGGAGEW